jgi:hypothetical protein
MKIGEKLQIEDFLNHEGHREHREFLDTDLSHDISKAAISRV